MIFGTPLTYLFSLYLSNYDDKIDLIGSMNRALNGTNLFASVESTKTNDYTFIDCDSIFEIGNFVEILISVDDQKLLKEPGFLKAAVKHAYELGQLGKAEQITWHASSIISDFEKFSDGVQHMENSGLLPFLYILEMKNESANQFQTFGLMPFVGQEIAIFYNDSASNAVKRLVRIAQDIVTNGPIQKPFTVKDIFSDDELRFDPVQNGRVVHVTCGVQNSTVN